MPNFLSQLTNTVTTEAISAFSPVASQRISQSLQNLSAGGVGSTALNLGFNALVPLVGGGPLEGIFNDAFTTVITNSIDPYAPPEIPVTPMNGTKPKPLYTTYAGSKAKGDPPYSEADIRFFLLRADQTVPEESIPGDPKPKPDISDIPTPPNSPLDAQTGGSGFLGSNLPNPFTQLAVGVVTRTVTNTANNLLGQTPFRGVVPLVGPLTGLQINRYLDPRTGQDEVLNTNSQRAVVKGGGTPSSVNNAVGANLSITSNFGDTRGYTANAEQYFYRLGERSFNLDDPTTPTTIDPNSFTFAGGSNSSLASNLSETYPWINSDTALSETIDKTGIPLSSIYPSIIPEIFSENALEVQTNNVEELIPKSWYFITSPKDVSWKKEGKASSVHTFGSNTPYITYGNTSLRTLTLGEVLLEGFSDRRTVESNILALETCMNMVMNKTIGYVAPYCWKLFAGGKNYGTFIITNVSVKEVMRDMRGFATRATVDIELQQVPEFQVNTGRDLASRAMVGELSRVTEQALVDPGREEAPRISNPSASGSGSGGRGGVPSVPSAGAASTPSQPSLRRDTRVSSQTDLQYGTSSGQRSEIAGLGN